MEEKRCHDCGAKEGEIHMPGCDMETCPFCLGQLISCGCSYKILGIDVSDGSWAYEHGVMEKQQEKWEKILEIRGLIPYIRIPFSCKMCGKLYPKMFHVSDEEWEKYVIPPLQPTILCRKCYDNQITLFPEGWRKAKKGYLLR